MVRLGLLYVWFYCGLLSSSTSDANKLIVGRAEAITGNEKKLDFFSYTDETSCGNVDNANPWCEKVNAESLTTVTTQYKCSCQCKWNMKTFLLDERRCVNKSYLMSRFGNGQFLLYPAINLTIDSHLNTGMRCHNCHSMTVEYHQANNTWKTMDSASWHISNNGRLGWQKYTADEVNGKIIKIQFNCQQRGHGQQGCSVYPQTLFCKSKGKTLINITAVTPTTTASILISSTVSSPISTTSAAISSTVTPISTTSAAIGSTVTPISTTSAAISSTVTPISTTSAAISSTVTPISTTSAAISSTLTPISTTSTAIISPTVTPTSTAIPTSAYASQPPEGDRHRTDEAGSPIGAIAGAVIACIILIIVIMFIIWKRRRKKSRPRKSTKATTNSTDNPMYLHNHGETIAIPHRKVNGSNVMGNEEYDYASIGGPSDHQKPSMPLYESLIKDNIRDSVYTPLSKEVLDSTPVEYSYNHLQHPQYNPPRSKSDPLYNTLEPPNNDEYTEPETRISDYQPGGSESVYNVLEGPDANPAPQDNDPVYNVLEDPNANQYPQDNDPVYNILEGPDDDDDDYDNAPLDDDESLPASGRDNVAYSSTIDLRTAQSPSSPDYDVLEGPEGALQDSTYQPLGVRVQDEVYQPLDRTPQPIYHSLEPNDSMA